MELEKSEKVFHDWLRKYCKKGQILEVSHSEKVFVVRISKLKKKDLTTLLDK